MGQTNQDALYQQAAAAYGAAMDRLARAYEVEPESRRDLLQEIHVALWRSFERFDGRCSMRTWVYRVAHNTATSYVLRRRRAGKFVSLEDVDVRSGTQTETVLDRSKALERLTTLIQHLQPLDRQVILSYLEGMDAASIGEIAGISPGNVATKIHRIKNILISRFHDGGNHER